VSFAVLLVSILSACREDIPRTFRSPEQAVEALTKAFDADDAAQFEALFGPGSLDTIRSGDEVADREDAKRVRALIAEGATYEDGAENTKWVSFGKEDPWPFPFPLVSADGKWRFDLQGGIEELHNRRIGRNELHALASLHAYVDAQREYWAAKPMGDPPRFAQKFRSDEGTRDGLYWPTAEGEEPSPLGELVAQAETEGYGGSQGSAGGTEAAGDDPEVDEGPAAFHGYHFRILTGQGKHTPGGELNYVDAKGNMTRGFAAVAWPVSYGNSGIMTFIVNHRGIVFEKDLGEATPTAATAMTVVDPDEGWGPTGD
jgi:hypothetical protein